MTIPQTSKLKLNKPNYEKASDIFDLNENFQKIDDSLGGLPSKVNQLENRTTSTEGKISDIENKATEAIQKADSVQTQFNQVVIEGDSSVEAAQARVNADGVAYPTLKNRLDDQDNKLGIWSQKVEEHETQLPSKAEKTYVDTQLSKKLDSNGSISVSQIDKNRGLIDQTYLTDELKQQMAGTTPINATPARDSINRGRMVSGSMPPDVLAFVDRPHNLFNKADIQRGYTIAHSTGEPTLNAEYSASYPYYIKANQQYITQNVFRSTFYNEAGTFISSTTSTSYTTPLDAYFVRFTVANINLNTAQVNEGNELKAYDEHKFRLRTSDKFPLEINPTIRSVTTDSLMEKAVNPTKTTFFESSKNIFNKKDVIQDRMIDSSGNLVEDTSFVTSVKYIDVKPSTTYSRYAENDTLVVAQYDINKNLVRRVAYSASTSSFTLESNTVFIRVSVRKSVLDRMMINEGSTLLPYEDYSFILKSSLEHPFSLDESLLPVFPDIPDNFITPQNTVTWFSSGDIGDYYHAATSPGDGSEGGFSRVSSVTTYDMFKDKWRELAVQNPNYITETYLGKDCTNTYDMYKYSLKNKHFDIRKHSGVADSDIKDYPKVIIVSGVHGEEKVAMYSLYWLVKDMIENWQGDEFLEYLRFNVNFEIIPVVNPSGFMTGFSGTRKNANGVDINRNFGEGWEEGSSDPNSSQYRGTAPFSEVETQYIRNLVLDNQDAVLFIDYHMHGGSGTDWNNMFWMGLYSVDAGKKYMPNLMRASKTTLSKCSRSWISNRGFQSDKDVIGFISVQPYGGLSSRYVGELGIPSILAECAKMLPTDEGTHRTEIVTASKDYIGNTLLNLLKESKFNPLK